MRYDFAPMEGITGAVYRRIHHRFFPGVDRYYAPFLSPTKDHRLAPKDLQEILPEYNEGIPLIPQLMTHSGADFCWAADALKDLGYTEVNLNLGCPSGTVTAKKKGAGLLADPPLLDAFLDYIFAHSPLPVSIKTRLGMTDPAEFPPLLALFARYPIAELTIHPRVRADFYSGSIRMEAFARAMAEYPGAICFNGDLTTAADCTGLETRFPRTKALMIGRGLLANPALIQQCKAGSGPDKETLRAFHDCLYGEYVQRFQSVRGVVSHMKEHWRYLSCLFEDNTRFRLQLRTAQDGPTYERLVDELFCSSPLRQNTAADW